MTIWKSRLIQFVWFVPHDSNIVADSVFTTLFKQDADTIQHNKVLRPDMPFLSAAIGQIDDVTCSVQIKPERIDLVIEASVTDHTHFDHEPRIPTQATINSILKKISSIPIPVIPSVNRLSIIANLVEIADDYQTAVSRFCDLSGVPLLFDDSLDLVFQINRRKSFEPNYEMNRIMRYGIERSQLIAINQNQHEIVKADRCGCALHLDFNTVPDGRIIPPDKQTVVLTKLGQEIIRVGTILNISSLED